MTSIKTRVTTVGHRGYNVIGIYELALFGDDVLLGNPRL